MNKYLDSLVSSLQEQLHASQSRSDVLRALAWVMGILLTGSLLSFASNAPAWFSILLSIFLSLSVGIYLGAYIYCLIYDRDALRSEKYTLHKMALQQGLLGDDRAGTFEAEALLPESNAAESQKLLGTK